MEKDEIILRVVISLPVTYTPVTIKRKTKNVHFIVDTGLPKTYMCMKILK